MGTLEGVEPSREAVFWGQRFQAPVLTCFVALGSSVALKFYSDSFSPSLCHRDDVETNKGAGAKVPGENDRNCPS